MMIISQKREELCKVARDLAENWINGNLFDVIDRIKKLSPCAAAFVASEIYKTLDSSDS